MFFFIFGRKFQDILNPLSDKNVHAISYVSYDELITRFLLPILRHAFFFLIWHKKNRYFGIPGTKSGGISVPKISGTVQR